MTKIKPNQLHKGDKVIFICPASPAEVDSERVREAVTYLESIGLEVVFGKSCFDKDAYLAGTDEIRLRDLMDAFLDPNIKGIICLKGGYGTSRIVDKIDFSIIKNNPKLFMGFSDITVLLNAFNQCSSLVTAHGLVGSFISHPNCDSFSKDNFENFLFGSLKDKVFTNPNNDFTTVTTGVVSGELVGGNLALVTALLGTKFEIDFKDKIVFLEDVNESPYRLDRMFSSLRLAGKLAEAKGFVLGTFSGCDGPENSKNYQDVIRDYFFGLKKPTIYNFSCGHSFPFINLAIGLEVEFDASKGSIKFLENFFKE